MLLTFGALMLSRTSEHKVIAPIYPANAMFCEGVPEPTLCPRGEKHWSMKEMRSSIKKFAALWMKRPPGAPVIGGVGVNHAFALWFTVQRLQPKYIIETGVFKGFSTWIMRQAAPRAHIFCLDPNPCVRQSTEPKWYGPGKKCWDMHFADQSPNTTYLTGGHGKFQDFSKVDWSRWIAQVDRTSTFVYFDDHMSALRRVKEMLKAGFIHLFYEDNVAHGRGSYSFSTMCSPATGNEVIFQDEFGHISRAISIHEHEKNVAELKSYIQVYFEFPAVFDGCAVADTGRSTSLFTKFEPLAELGFTKHRKDLIANDDNSDWWTTLYPPYVRLRKPTSSWLSVFG